MEARYCDIRKVGPNQPAASRMRPVEALVTPDGGDFSIKLEDQVLITGNEYENLTIYPFDASLMGIA